MGGYVTISPTPSGDITGSGTANYIAMFTGSNTIGNSTISQSNNAYIPAIKDLNFASPIIAVAPNMNTGQQISYAFYGGTDTSQTTAQEINRYLFSPGNRQWEAGTVAIQREFYVTSPVYSFVSASTITVAYTMYVKAATAGANATITNNFALGLESGTATVKIGNLTGTTANAAIYMNQSTPAAYNYTLYGDTSGNTYLNCANQINSVNLMISSASIMQLLYGKITFSPPAVSSSSLSSFVFNAPSNTTMTASTEIPGYLYNSYSRQWAAGTITTQREHYIKTVTYAFASASTITTAYGCYIEAPTAGSNATITNNYALGVSGNAYFSANVGISIAASGSYGLSVANSINISSGALTFAGGDSRVVGARTSSIYGLQFLGYNGTSLYTSVKIQTTNTSGNLSGGITSDYLFLPQAWTNQTASTERNSLKYTSASTEWAAGAITTQREIYITSPTYSFVSASTITSAYTLYVEAPTAGSNATITNKYALGLSGGLGFVDNNSRITSIPTGANGLIITNPKNSANTGVSGTVKTVEIDIGGTPYYFLVYPTSSA